MKESLPTSISARFPEERAKLKRIVASRGLVGLANDTKWDELISAVRSRPQRPSYRFKCIDGPPSRWDCEWSYHLPFPMISVEWFEIVFRYEVRKNLLVPPDVTDHSPWLVPLLKSVGLEFKTGSRVVRIFGYSPRNLEGFED